MIPKYVQARDDSWVSVIEFPDQTLRLEGIRPHPTEEGAFMCSQVRFTVEAVRQLVPLMQKWLKDKS